MIKEKKVYIYISANYKFGTPQNDFHKTKLFNSSPQDLINIYLGYLLFLQFSYLIR